MSKSRLPCFIHSLESKRLPGLRPSVSGVFPWTYKSGWNGFCPQLVILVVTSKSHCLHTFSKRPVNKVCSSSSFFFSTKAFVSYLLPKSPHSLPGGRGFNQPNPGMLVATTDGRALHHRPFWVVLLPGWLSLPTLLLVADAEPIPAARVSVSQPRSQDTSRMVTASPAPRPAHRFILCFWEKHFSLHSSCSLCRRNGGSAPTRGSRGRVRSRHF